ncbi:membrane protein [Streptomyces leeuwenhoekii]|uniref:Membrane protein n=1 Tax=Streptomyces leeuwenhoekii TaxID=1437453 RepID=A0A0F7VNP7_STRLW|nr:membrane protein [Streptomyces leeuwenhoekii]KMS66288.1 membrane protein [Streptomyces leeuwenhoekii]CQR59933.1 Integral Membrane Protein [Streptomyces leeuwenhoekii]
MTKFLLTLHVLAAIIAVGPVTVAASMFPPAVRRAALAGGPRTDGEDGAQTAAAAVGTVRLLHRICRVYAGLGVAVPLLGFATASAMGVLGDGWLIASIVLTAVAAGVLAAFVLPRQEELVEQLTERQPVERPLTVRLAMFTGIFNLLWATVTVLMIVRPGSTTGA